jgi:DNA-binding CsgD family transcriptional regulator
MATFAKDALQGKVCLVTGGGTGIGRELCLGLAGSGAEVAIASRKIENCEKVAEECRALGATWLEARRTSPGQLAGMLRGVNHRLPRSVAGNPDGEVLCRLSPREHEVLAHLASGADNLTIAACLDITVRTVRAHVSALYLKVGGESRAQLALRGRELGL